MIQPFVFDEFEPGFFDFPGVEDKAPQMFQLLAGQFRSPYMAIAFLFDQKGVADQLGGSQDEDYHKSHGNQKLDKGESPCRCAVGIE